MKRIPLYHYVAINNPSGGAKVIEHFNLPRPSSKKDIARALRYVMVTFGEEGFREIAKVHPDRELILDSEEVIEVPEVKSEACGCSSNAEGNNTSPNVSPNQDVIDAIKELKTKEKAESEKSTQSDKGTQLTKEDIANEVKKVLGDTKPFIKDSLPYIALGGVALFLFYGVFKTK